MQDDARDVAVRAFLREMAVEVPPPSIPTATLVRRARWGMGARIGGLAVALLLAASGISA